MSGRLVLCATPIGNLADLAPRAVEELAAADVVVAEDTRQTRKLLNHAGIDAALVSYHKGNERSRDKKLILQMEAGSTVVLVTDAGMPGISDPGEELVRAAIDHGIDVSCIPGPSAVLAALVVSGQKTDRFVFDGFLPRTKAQRLKRLGELADDQRTIVLFEAPHRLRRALADASEMLGDTRRVSVCRELTKLHEEIWRGTLGAAVEHWSAIEPRGEFVLVIEGASRDAADAAREDAARREIEAALAGGASTRDAAAAAAELGISRKRAYDLALDLSKRGSN